MNRSLPSLIAGALLVLVLVLYMITFQVRFTQVAVLKTFGKSTPPTSEDPTKNSGDVIREPGLYWKWPWPIQQVAPYDNRIQLSTNAGEETPTKDGKPIIVTTTVAWRIKDPYLFNRTCGNMKEGTERLRTLVRNDQKTVISDYPFEAFVSTKASELQYDQIEKRILQEVQGKATRLYGIAVENIGMERLALPQRITESVFDAMKKERQAEVARVTSEGESRAIDIKARAEQIADTIQTFAVRKEKEIINEGLKQANRFYEVFRKDEALATFLLKIENLPKLLKDQKTTMVLDQSSPLLDLLFKPQAATRPAGASATESRKADTLMGAALPQETISPR